MIGLIGLNYKQAPIQIREQFSLSDAEAEAFIPVLTENEDIEAGIILSTCNRTEIYFQANSQNAMIAFSIVMKALNKFKKTDTDLSSYFYKKTNTDVTHHLFRVAAGLDSLVLGEDQIIGQIKAAYLLNKDIQNPGKYLTRLFEKALEAGKKVRSQTTINMGASSVSAASVDTSLKHFGGSIKDKNVLMIGAGETGALAVQSLAKHGFNSLYIANRTRSKAEDLARRYSGTAIKLRHFSKILNIADIIIVATSAPHPVITRNMMKRLEIDPKHASKLLIDLSVPRNICSKVDEDENITLYSVDDLQKIIQKTSEIRKGAVEDAKEIIAELCTEYTDWYEAQKLTPVIIKIKENMAKFSEMQTAEFKGKAANEDLPLFSNYLTKKYIGHFIKNLKKAAKNGKQAEFIEFANELFEIEA